MNIIHIIKGNINRLFNLNQGLAEEREERACKKCFNSHVDGKYTGVCQSGLGCGCPVKSASTLASLACPLQVFHWDWINEDRLHKLNKENNFSPHDWDSLKGLDTPLKKWDEDE